VASARAAIAGGSQVAYHDPRAWQAPQLPPDGGAAAWAAFFQGRGGAGTHGSSDAAWSTHVLPDDSTPTVATTARTRTPHRRTQLESSSAPAAASTSVARTGILGSGRLKALTSAATVAERLSIAQSRLLKLAPTVMLGVEELKPSERSFAGEAWLQAAARRIPTATARTPESQQLKKARPIGQHWLLGALPAMRHIDPRDGAGMILN